VGEWRRKKTSRIGEKTLRRGRYVFLLKITAMKILQLLKSKTSLWIIIFILAMIFYNRCNHYKQENKRLSNNQTALLEKATYFENKYGESQASVQRLLLTDKELRQSNSTLTNEVKRLGLKLSRVNSITQTAMQNTTTFEAKFQDTPPREGNRFAEAFKAAGEEFNARYVSYSDGWNSFSGYEVDGVLKGKSTSVDTLMQVVHRVPKKCWFFRYGTKGIRQEITLKNPNSRIFYNEYVELK
jgi:Tfp pilus assembly protein PilE